MMIAAAIGSLLSFVLLRPILMVARFLFRHVFVHLYRWYRTIKTKLSTMFAPAKNRILYPVLNKSTIHVVLGIIAVAVLINNFVIKETRAEEFGKDMLLGAMTPTLEDIEITETALVDTTITPDYFQITGTITTLDATPSQPDAAIGGGADILLAGGGALVNPNLSSTTVGNRPREDVVYHIVQGGETVSTIAEQYGISVNTILWENKLGARDYIKPGDKLTILPQSGVSHQVQSGETLAGIAKKFKADVDDIVEYNKLVDATDIEKDQILIIPGGEVEPPKPTITTPSSSSSSLASGPIPPSSTAASTGSLVWPTSGHRISQYYKYGHTGVDITGNYSSPIYAADSGRVIYAAADRSGYGLHIIIDHGNGLKTLYGHASKIFVRVGDSISRGQTIAMIGCTGRCTGPHIHFEVRTSYGFANPLSYL